ncbi:hypothetical protein MBLNU13_g00093t1 [Cladosporium sp. NU13]
MMLSMSKTSIFALNTVVFTLALIQILRSRIEHHPRVHPTEIVGLIFACIIHTVGLVFFALGLPRPTAGRALVIAASVFNVTVLLELLIGGSNVALYSYLVNALWLAEIAMVGYTFVYGEAVEATGTAERKPLLEDLQGMQSQLDEIEKRIAELRALARQQVDESSP